jgi:hypothetical protein
MSAFVSPMASPPVARIPPTSPRVRGRTSLQGLLRRTYASRTTAAMSKRNATNNSGGKYSRPAFAATKVPPKKRLATTKKATVRRSIY